MLVQYYLKLVRYSGMCGIWYSGTVLLKVGTYSTVFWYVWYTVYDILVRMVFGIWYSPQMATICHLWLQMYNSLTMEPLDPMCFGCTLVSTV